MNRRARSILGLSGVLALGLASSCGGEEEDPAPHGFVCINFSKAQTADSSIFAATSSMRIKLRYETCLQDFYSTTHTEYRLDGVEGEKIFNEWAGMLCTEGGQSLPCEVDGLSGFQQTIFDDPPNSEFSLAVTYKLKTQGEIIGRRVRWGPLPLEQFAGCSPTVDIAAPGDIQGFDASGNPIWKMEGFSNVPNKARDSEGGCIEVDLNSA